MPYEDTQPNKIYNLLLTPNTDSSYNYYVLEYNLTPEELANYNNNHFEDLKPSSLTLLENFTLEVNLKSGQAEEDC